TYPDSSIRLRETSTGKQLARFHRAGELAVCLAFSADGKLLASGHLTANRYGWNKQEETLVRIWDVAKGREIRQLKGAWYAVWSVAFSPDGKTLAVGTQFNTIHLWEVATGRERRRFAGDRCTIKALAFTPDGRLLASGHDRTALVWDVTAL